MIVSDAGLADEDKSEQTILELETKLEDAIQELSMLKGKRTKAQTICLLEKMVKHFPSLKKNLHLLRDDCATADKLLEQDAKEPRTFEELSLATRKVSEMENLISGQDAGDMVLNPSVSDLPSLKKN